MRRETYVTDTHPLFWHLRRDDHLKGRAKQIFEHADQGEGKIVIPAIVWFELYYVVEKEKRRHGLRKNLNVAEALAWAQGEPGYDCPPMEPEIVAKFPELAVIPEMHDRMIAAEALLRGVPCLTKDEKILKSDLVRCIQADRSELV